jgi:hypothetical protein
MADTRSETRDDDVLDARNVEPRGLLTGTIPGEPHEGGSQDQATAAGGTDQEELMERLEARRGTQRAGEPIEGVHIGTPAGATSDALRNREEVPVREDNKGQQKDRTGINARRTP